MRVGLVIYGSLDTVSGGYLYDRMLVDHLLEQGDQVEIISLPWRNYFRHLGDNFSQELITRLEKLHLDVLIQDELCHPSLCFVNGVIKRRFHYPVISLVHHLRSSESHPWVIQRLHRYIEGTYLKSVDGFIFNSQATRKSVEILRKDKKLAPWVAAVPAGDRLEPCISPDEIAARARKNLPLRLLFVGNLIPRKGLHFLIGALRRLPKNTWSLKVVGNTKADERFTRRIRRAINAYGMTLQVDFLGVKDDRELASLYRDSQVLVVPSSYEGYGIVYIEGMGFGLPAIGSRVGAAGEIIQHGINGYLVSPGDERSLAQFIEIIWMDRGQLVEMSLAALRTYRAHPIWADTTRTIRDFLLTVV